jgi:hypothetical protein
MTPITVSAFAASFLALLKEKRLDQDTFEDVWKELPKDDRIKLRPYKTTLKKDATPTGQQA